MHTPMFVISNRLAKNAIVGMIALALSACSTNPIVQWQVPARPQGAPDTTLDYGHEYLSRARAAYRAAIVLQLQQSNDLANGLVTTGALVAALAVGKAHRDAIIGASFLGGTAYTLGNMNLNRQRLLVYQAGVEALNCANRAVAAFDMPLSELRSLEEAIEKLDRQRGVVSNSRQVVEELLRRAVAMGQGDTTIAQDAKAALTRSAASQKTSSDAVSAGRGLANSAHRASGDLVLAVDRIDAAIVRATLETVPDLSAVPKIIAGLAGTFDLFAPGANIAQDVGKALKGYSTPGVNAKSAAGEIKSSGGELQPLMDARLKLDSEIQTLADALIDVSSRLGGRSGSLTPDTFKDCGVVEVVTALKTTPEVLQFTVGKDDQRSLIISGGTKPYFVEIDGKPVSGIALKAPIPFESRAEITVAKELVEPQSVSLRIMDASSPTRSAYVEVKVNAATKSADPKVKTEEKKDPIKPVVAAMTADQVKDELNKNQNQPILGLPSGMVIRTAVAVMGKKVTVPLTCPPDLKEFPTSESVVAALKLKAGVKKGAKTDFEMALDAKGTDGKSCLK